MKAGPPDLHASDETSDSAAGGSSEELAVIQPRTGTKVVELRAHPAGQSFPTGAAAFSAEHDDLERSRSSSPVRSRDVMEKLPSVWEPFMNRFRLLAVCVASVIGGLNDGAFGALIPYIQSHYSIDYAMVSMIFVGHAIGFIFAAAFLDSLRDKLGRGKVLGLGQALMLLGYLPVVFTAPFAVVALSFIFVGFGIATNDAVGNVFCGGLQNGTFMLGLLHGSFGLGGMMGPLIATTLMTVAETVWSRYYIVTFGLIVICVGLSLWAFNNYEKEQGSPANEPLEASPLLGVYSTLNSRVILLGSIFIFAYQGAEVSISGWVISFLITARDGDPSSVGYVTAAFWACITIGRLALAGPAQRIGEKLFIYCLTLGALAFQVLVWAVPNIVTNAVAISIVGLMLGPIYPCSAAVFLRNMTRREAVSGMSTISACGSLGGAVAPFITGLLAQAVGTSVLHPIAISMFIVMLICWWEIPSEDKRSD
ncbi:unnamed protein product [Clonostachys byssicola]|uniref:Major facilitator superfamily (MFS) profile domain-containing protein n=1 Tax=Clonostachys byssicola TaxID=160290 RepID=A0A9N9XX15_9HYPO|nr:unnamed protein product [Clonostachys byssicola]